MKASPPLIIHIIANAAHGIGLSGGDRIFIECAKRWASKGCKIFIHVQNEGYQMCKRNSLEKVSYMVFTIPSWKVNIRNPLVHILITIKSMLWALRTETTKSFTVVYSASEFWMNSLPALLLKFRHRRNVKWVAGFYLFAPRPFSKENPYRSKYAFMSILYFLYQLPVYLLVRKYADMVWVTNELDRWKFINGKRLTSDKVIAVRGGVDAKTPLIIPEPKEKKFDAVFIGRFHPQKGVLELIDIWKMVCDKKLDAKLAMIGVGDLKSQVREKIRRYNLENNIVLFGFKDGVEKLRIFKNSKIVVHPAIYDSGGMAPCEAMACGLPGVSFDLPALRTYYPKGMLKTPCFNLRGFAENILKLLNDQELYRELQKEALELAKEWDWDKRAEELLKIIMGFLMKNE